jgi:hypothetical protein
VTGALGQIGRAFDEAGITWVAMKGPVVAATLYPEPGDRAYADLDLLVDRRDFPTAVRLLEELGYQHKIHDWALAEDMLAGQITMASAVLDVDLHWHLHYSSAERRPYAFDPDAMLERRRLVTASGVQVPTLDPVDTLLNLAFHAARSDGHRLIWLKDVERSLAVDQPDLEELVRRCRAYRCGPPVGLILGRASTLLDADAPPEVVGALAPTALRTSERLVATVSHPIGLHEHQTVMRWFTRSARATPVATLAEVPGRTVRNIGRRVRPRVPSETDDPTEKARYLAAVASSR